MPKLSISIPTEQAAYLQTLDTSWSKGMQIAIDKAMKADGYVWIPGKWEKH